MMRICYLLILITGLGLHAKTLNVGKDKEFTSLSSALDESKEGDTVFIYPGTYEVKSPDGINFIKLKSGVTVKGVDKLKVILKPVGENPAYEAFIKIIDQENVSIDGVTIDSPYGNIYIKNSKNITISNCVFKGFRWSTKRQYSLRVPEGSAFSGSSNLTLTKILFDNCNPVHLGSGNSGLFKDNCLHKVENTNYWHFSKDSNWKYEDIIAHRTELKKAHQNVDKIHNLAAKQPWLEIRDGLSWGAVKALWMPLKKRIEEKKESSASFLDSLEQVSDNSDEIDINIEVKEGVLIDRQGPTIYIEERQRFRDIDKGVPHNKLKGRVDDVSGVASLTIFEKSAELVNGKAETLYKYEVPLKDGNFEQELELDNSENLVILEAVDRKGNRSYEPLMIRQELPSSKKDDPPTLHLFKKKTSDRIISITRPSIERKSYIVVKGYTDFPENIASIKVGKIPASIDRRGNFSLVVPLKKGENDITVIAKTLNGKEESASFEVEALFLSEENDMDKPVIKINKTRSLNTKLSGIIKDNSAVPLFLIDGEEVKLDQRGMFEYKLKLNPDENIIRLEAYDTVGNYTITQEKISGSDVYQSITKDVEFHALVIGINNYKNLPDLKTPVNDATAVKDVLEKNYGFNVTVLKNATRKVIINQLEKLREELKPEHKLLIYYAGHGYYDQKTERSFWLPADAEKEDAAFWISAYEIRTNLKFSKPKNILVVSDSCFAGTLSGNKYDESFKDSNEVKNLQTKLTRPCRLLLSSGGNEPVVDGDKNHSIFAEAFLWSLREPPSKIFSVEDIYPGIYEIVTSGETTQKPDLAYIQEVGHTPGGGFVFTRSK